MDSLGDLDVDGRMMLKFFKGIGWGGVDLIRLAQDRDKWRAVVNTVMNFGIT